MKKIFLFLLLLGSIISNAQIVGFTSLGQNVTSKRFAISQLFSLPQDTFAIPTTLKQIRWTANKGDSIWVWSVYQQKWILGGGGGGGGGGTLTGTGDNLLKIASTNVNTNKTFGTLTYAAGVTWDMTTGFDKKLTLTGDANITFSNIQNGDQGTLTVIQDGSGGHALTVPSQTISIKANPNDTTVLSFLYDGGVYYWATNIYTVAGAYDANISSPTTGQALLYSGGKWTNSTINTATVGTYAQRLALSPSNGNEFFQTNDGRNAPAGKYYYLNGVWNMVPMTDEDFWYYFNDFVGNTHTVVSLSGSLRVGVSGAGATESFSSGNSMFYGLFATGTTTGGWTRIDASDGAASGNSGFKPSTTNMYYQISIPSVSQKSNLADVFNIDAGFVTSAIGNPYGGGYYFRYDSATSANWLYRNGGGSLTSTGVAFASATPYVLEVLVRSDSVFYWINNVSVAAEATANNTNFHTPVARIIKTLGTTSVTMSVDYLKVWARLQSSRTNYGN